MVKYTLSYFDVRGRGEIARVILSYGKADCEDVRIPYAGMGASPIPDAIKARLPYGQFPLLEVDGKLLAQSGAIYHFLATEFKLTGKDEFEEAKADEIVNACNDISKLFPFHEKDPTKRAEGIKEATTKAREQFLSKFNHYIQVNGGHLVGKDLTWADIVLACKIDTYQRVTKIDLTEGLPALAALFNKILEHPRIKEWVESRPVPPS